MKTYLKLFVFLLLVFPFSGCGNNDDTQNKTAEAKTYFCPMHPEVQSDRPGVCPICHMDLVLKDSPSAENAMESSAFVLSKDDMIKANIISEPVTMSTSLEEIRISGKMEIPEQNIKIIAAKFSGRIEKLLKDQTGQDITAGDPLFEVYSDELIRLFTELRSANSLKDEKLISAIKERLMLRGITRDQISALAESGNIPLTITYLAPYSGVILEKNISEGSYINEGSQLFKVADLKTMWAVGDVYSDRVHSIKPGQNVRIELQRNKTVYNGKIIFISPVLDEATRSVKIRAEIPNLSSVLRANEFVTLTFSTKAENAILVPSTAVIRTGLKDIIWVQTGKTEFLPHEVILGSKSGDKFSVVSGLQEGDRIVTNGVYLLDSESRLRNFTGGVKSASVHDHTQMSKPKEPVKEVKAELLGKSELKAFNDLCPILGDEVSNKNPKVRYKGKIWGFCCPGCDTKFAADPAKYSQNISTDGKKYLGIYED